jgi:hypothetical protein
MWVERNCYGKMIRVVATILARHPYGRGRHHVELRLDCGHVIQVVKSRLKSTDPNRKGREIDRISCPVCLTEETYRTKRWQREDPYWNIKKRYL